MWTRSLLTPPPARGGAGVAAEIDFYWKTWVFQKVELATIYLQINPINHLQKKHIVSAVCLSWQEASLYGENEMVVLKFYFNL